MKTRFLLLPILLLLFNCSEEVTPNNPSSKKNLTIFFVNDQHGQLDNFAKIKHIIEQEKLNTNVLVACSGDIFSGNPIVDNHAQKGYPIIDVMNQVGFDISVLGNHEFDYGEATLKNRIAQAEFDWVCANVDMGTSGIPEPDEFKTLTVDGLKVTFLGLVETNGKQGAIIPSTHPWRIKNLTFQRPESVVSNYQNLKFQEGSDLLIALTHLGHSRGNGQLGDFQLASQYPFFDLIIGGHSHRQINEEINNIPVFQAGSNLNYLGKITLRIKNKSVDSYQYEQINLNSYTQFDEHLKTVIDNYNASPDLQTIIGSAQTHHNSTAVGCFFTDALRNTMNVDLSIQNTGGIRSSINQGDITKREIYEVDPFNNGTIIYSMTVGELKTFLKGANAGFYFSGLQFQQIGDAIEVKDMAGNTLLDHQSITIGINDYIPAVYDNFFPSSGTLQALSSAETLINFLQTESSTINYTNCSNYFRYD